ncbi:MAG: hypothetical protein ABI072_10650 [Edaphobacter sp.]
MLPPNIVYINLGLVMDATRLLDILRSIRCAPSVDICIPETST